MSDGLTGPQKTLLFIIMVFVLPVMLAYGAYFTLGWWYPQATTNHGELIVPAHPLQQPSLFNLPQKEPLAASLLQGKWSLIIIGDGRCEKVCLKNLYKTRQVRTALHKDTHRLQRLLFAYRPLPKELLKNLEKQHSDLKLISADPPFLDALFMPFLPSEGLKRHQGQQVFLVDPLGNLMMRYRVDYEAKGLLKDLRRLLKISQIG